MIEEILPRGVFAAHVFGDVEGAALYPEEESLVARAVEKRQREFATTRLCARRALSLLGETPGPLRAGPRGEPLWAAGLVGSLTHCDGYRAAAVARGGDIVALGIDAEPDGPLPGGVLDLVTLPEERRVLRALGRFGDASWDRLLFSAKESVFKAWYPVTRRELAFREAVLDIDPRHGTFEAHLLVLDRPFAGPLSGRWLCRDGWLVTSVVVTGAAVVPGAAMTGAGAEPAPAFGR